MQAPPSGIWPEGQQVPAVVTWPEGQQEPFDSLVSPARQMSGNGTNGTGGVPVEA
jgi:hypothetical protein